MPLYEYRCDACGEEFEAFSTLAARQTAPCPTCGQRGRKLISPVGIVFQGSGFHVTDYPNADRTSGQTREKADVAVPEKKTPAAG